MTVANLMLWICDLCIITSVPTGAFNCHVRLSNTLTSYSSCTLKLEGYLAVMDVNPIWARRLPILLGV